MSRKCGPAGAHSFFGRYPGLTAWANIIPRSGADSWRRVSSLPPIADEPCRQGRLQTSTRPRYILLKPAPEEINRKLAGFRSDGMFFVGKQFDLKFLMELHETISQQQRLAHWDVLVPLAVKDQHRTFQIFHA